MLRVSVTFVLLLALHAGAAFADDRDHDGVADESDNCQTIPNADQLDFDGDGTGDVCDSCPAGGFECPNDFDDDGVLNETDNCVFKRNFAQEDGDDDHVGDACDNCLTTPNTDQTDVEPDSVGDACDPCLPGQACCGNYVTDTDEDCDGPAICCTSCEAVAQGTSCFSDGNICTDDACDDAGACVHTPITQPVPCTTTTTLPSFCGHPLSAGSHEFFASDALFILRTALGREFCDPCRCDTNHDDAITVSDAQRVLLSSVGNAVDLDCTSCF